MAGLLTAATTFSSTSVTAAGGTQVASYTAPAAGFVVPSVRLSSLNTSGRQTVTLYQVLNDATNDYPSKRGSQIKAASADTRMELGGFPVWLDAGDILKTRIESSSASDTSISGSVRFLDAGNPVDGVTLAIAAVTALVTAVWAATTRTLTAFGFQVTTDAASRTASQANVSGLATQSSLDAVASAVATKSSQSSVTALGSPLQAGSYTAPDNASIGTIATTVAALPSASAIAAAVWAAGSRTLTGFGSLVADIWGYATRTLSAFGFTNVINNWIITETAASPASSPAKIALVRGLAYDLDHANAFHWSSAAWPSLAGAAVTFTATSRQTGDVDLEDIECVVLANVAVRLSLASADTLTLDLGDAAYRWTLTATLADDSVVVLAQGYIEVSDS